jgi:hypothetical protein
MQKDAFKEIFAACASSTSRYDPLVVDYLIEILTGEFNQPLRACYGRDVINQIRWGAQYEGHEPQVTKDTVLQACKNYFLTPA